MFINMSQSSSSSTCAPFIPLDMFTVTRDLLPVGDGSEAGHTSERVQSGWSLFKVADTEKTFTNWFWRQSSSKKLARPEEDFF